MVVDRARGALSLGSPTCIVPVQYSVLPGQGQYRAVLRLLPGPGPTVRAVEGALAVVLVVVEGDEAQQEPQPQAEPGQQGHRPGLVPTTQLHLAAAQN